MLKAALAAAMDAAVASIRDVARLVLPVECPGCGLPDVLWCQACAQCLSQPLRRVEQDADRLDIPGLGARFPVWALASYEGPVRGLLTAWKDKGRADVDSLLVPALRQGLAEAVAGPVAGAGAGSAGRAGVGPVAVGGAGAAPTGEGLEAVPVGEGWGLGSLAGPVLVVPMPSRSAAVMRRGRVHLQPVARALAQCLGGRTANLLRHRGKRDQSGLSARMRAHNIRIQLSRRGRARLGNGPGISIVLLDDVITTGASLAAAQKCLARAGAQVIGALCLAATPRPALSQRPEPG